MGNFAHICISGLILVPLLIQPVASLQCYICDTLKTKDCGDTFKIPPWERSTCPAGSRCVMFRGFRGPVTAEVYRYCSFDFKTDGCRPAYENAIDGTACVCSTNLCNSGETVRSRPVTVFLVICTIIYQGMFGK